MTGSLIVAGVLLDRGMKKERMPQYRIMDAISPVRPENMTAKLRIGKRGSTSRGG